MRRLAFLLTLTACKPTLYVYSEHADEHRVEIRDASRLMGVRVKTVDQPGRGAVALEFKGHDAGVCGAALEKAIDYPEHAADPVVDCTPHAWSCSSALFVAHELGHVLTLSHRDGTAMAAAPEAEATFTTRQTLQMRAAAAVFGRTCGEPDGVVSDPLDPGAQ